MVGRAVTDHCASIGDVVRSYGRDELDITDSGSVNRTVERDRPDVIINCAAWTDVDGCEFDHERAVAANALGPENLARASKDFHAHFITISTDYVFDGTKDGFYTQNDQPNPQSIYAKSKLEGEERAQLANSQTMVARTGYVFGIGGRNFLSSVVERARAGQRLQVINDAFGTPTYARDLAIRLRELAEVNHAGIYHVVNAGEGVSFEGFAQEALAIAGVKNVNLEPVSMDSMNRPAPRPKNSRMRCLLSEQLGLVPMPDWRVAVREFVTTAANAAV